MRPHLLAVPFPGQGHVNPLIQLCCRLLHSHGILVTYLNLDYVQKRIEEARTCNLQLEHRGDDQSTAGIRFLTMSVPPSHSFKQGEKRTFAKLANATEALANSLRGVVLRLIEEGQAVTGILSDALTSTWTQEVADQLRIPRIAFLTFSQSVNLYFSYPPPHAEDSSSDRVVISGLPPLHPRDLPTFVHIDDDTAYVSAFISRQYLALNRAERILINTFDDLEHQAINAMSKRQPVSIEAIGPLLPSFVNVDNNVNHEPSGILPSNVVVSFWVEQEECIEWLNEQAACSVLYVSFGSVAILTREHFQDILLGLESLHSLRFLFVVRPGLVENDDHGNLLDEGFIHRIGERGFFTSWVPQLKVLSHPSISAFFSHCGWNSTLESISTGKPMICWPYFADQMMNAKFVVDEWKIGMEIRKDGPFKIKEEVRKTVYEVMEGEEGKEMRKRVRKLQEAALANISSGGSSYNNMLGFAQSLYKWLKVDHPHSH